MKDISINLVDLTDGRDQNLHKPNMVEMCSKLEEEMKSELLTHSQTKTASSVGVSEVCQQGQHHEPPQPRLHPQPLPGLQENAFQPHQAERDYAGKYRLEFFWSANVMMRRRSPVRQKHKLA